MNSNIKTNEAGRMVALFIGFALPFLSYILLSVLYAGVDPFAIRFAGTDQWYDIPRNENIIFHLSKNWSNFSFLDQAYYKHPPLFFYLSAFAYRLGNETGLLLFMAFISICAVLATYFFIKELYGHKMALATAILLAYAPGFFDASFHVMFDTGALLFYALCALIIYKSLKWNSWLLTIIAGIVSGLMLLFKTVLGLLFVGCAVFILLLCGLRLMPKLSLPYKLLKMTSIFVISLLVYSPYLIYQRFNHGGYNWWLEFRYQLPWQKSSIMPPSYFYLAEAVSRWGWFFCGLIILGIIRFFCDLRKYKKAEDLFLFTTSLVPCLFFSIWTTKSFRFLSPVYPFLIYLAILGILSIVTLANNKLNLPSRLCDKLFIVFLMGIISSFAVRNSFVFKNIPGESPYRIAANYIKRKGLSSACYLSDERVIFQNYIQESTFWSQQDFNYNLAGIIGYDIRLAVINPSNKKFAPLGDPIAIFNNNDKTVGLYPIDQDVVEAIKGRHPHIDVEVVDSNNRPLPGAFIAFYAERQFIFFGRTGNNGVARLLYFNKNPITIEISAWGKRPLAREVNTKAASRLRVRMENNKFLINGLSFSTY